MAYHVRGWMSYQYLSMIEIYRSLSLIETDRILCGKN